MSSLLNLHLRVVVAAANRSVLRLWPACGGAGRISGSAALTTLVVTAKGMVVLEKLATMGTPVVLAHVRGNVGAYLADVLDGLATAYVTENGIRGEHKAMNLTNDGMEIRQTNERKVKPPYLWRAHCATYCTKKNNGK